MAASFPQKMEYGQPGSYFRARLAPRIHIGGTNLMPVIGLATWKSSPTEVFNAVRYAISIGYRYIDCAFAYQNEDEVGRAIIEKLADNTVEREDLFIASKLWNTFHRREKVVDCCTRSLKSLGLSYLDLYVIHWPIAFADQREEYFPKYKSGEMVTEYLDFTETWKGMEDLHDRKLVKSIGLANFNIKQIQRILVMCRIKPAVLQVECHPYFKQDDLIAFCKRQGIAVTAYTPLGAPNRPWIKPPEQNVLTDLKITEMAQRYNKTPAQIALKFNIERRVSVIPASVKEEEIEEFLQIFDFDLTEEDKCILSSCPQIRFNTYSKTRRDLNYPFVE